MKVRILICLLICSIDLCAQSQSSYVFKVLASKGTNLVKKGDTGKEVNLKPGLNLMQKDAIIASAGAYIGLMHRSGKTIELRRVGVTKITDLESKLAQSKSSIAEKYANFVWQKMEDDPGITDDNYRANMKATGAVERAGSYAIGVNLPLTNQIIGTDVSIRWNALDSVTSYEIIFKNIYDEELLNMTTIDSALQFSINEEPLANQDMVILTIQAKNNTELTSADYAIQKLSSDQAETYQTAVEKLKSEVDTSTPIGLLMMAAYYEDQSLMVDAINTYEIIVSQYPEIDDFKKLYESFLLRNGLYVGK